MGNLVEKIKASADYLKSKISAEYGYGVILGTLRYHMEIFRTSRHRPWRVTKAA
jgi:hypothetical protein